MRVVTIFRGIHKLCPEFLQGPGCLSAAAAFGSEKDQISGINRGRAYFKQEREALMSGSCSSLPINCRYAFPFKAVPVCGRFFRLSLTGRYVSDCAVINNRM